ncbi:MAG: hypothetical protein QF471_03195 [Phycisphaerales bacterium]|jgi:putative protease|nr:hypothetical protein [Phycisphaerales bacterium]
MSEKQIGHISHWFGNIGVVVIDVDKGTLTVGDTIHVKGNTTDFTQTIESMQLDGETVEKAKKGMSVGVKVSDRARRTDLVFKVAD